MWKAPGTYFDQVNSHGHAPFHKDRQPSSRDELQSASLIETD
jgi:hypothetical protein